MIRYYRNHPCVVMWESAMNESVPPAAWCDSAQAIAHAEYPGDQMYTCGQDAPTISVRRYLDMAAVQAGGAAVRTQATTQQTAGHFGIRPLGIRRIYLRQHLQQPAAGDRRSRDAPARRATRPTP